jgi:hypothetical protein|tara:strand:- start:103 stop:960 length:858 start_codon:yes stop_codon:yes gene_type:complete
MKIFIYNTSFHFKNKFFIEYFINTYHTRVNNINDADIIYSPDKYIDIHLYPTKKFIFGPHFSVFPNNIVSNFNNIHNNAIYIQPSQPFVDTWQKEFNFKALPMKAMSFGVDTQRFIGNEKSTRNNIIVYYKSRDPGEMKLLTTFLNNKKINYKIFNYQKRYNENEFLSYLKTCKYGIVLGRHESQGFAIEEMLSCDVPLLIWGVTLHNQEYPYRNEYKHVKSNVPTVPYWSSECGELFYNYTELENSYNKFISNIEKYKPRQFILDNLSMETCSKRWNELLTYEI